jgi:hypothetical protein
MDRRQGRPQRFFNVANCSIYDLGIAPVFKAGLLPKWHNRQKAN